jgi:hypothetical protein
MTNELKDRIRNFIASWDKTMGLADFIYETIGEKK